MKTNHGEPRPVAPIIWGGSTGPNSFLYHYTDAASAMSILESNRFRFSPLARSNDPMERRSPPLTASSPLDLGRHAPSFDCVLDEWYSSRAAIRTASFSRDDPTIEVPAFADEISNSRRGFGRSRMWAQYASSHQGVCLVFDWSRLIEAFVTGRSPDVTWVKSGEIGYEDKRSLPNQDFNLGHLRKDALGGSLDAHMQLHVERLYFRKSAEWRDELEVRWLAAVADTGRDTPLEFDLDEALVAVILGDRSSPQTRAKLLSAFQPHGKTVFQIGWFVRGPVVACY